MSKEAMKLAQELRALADRFSEGWHEGIKIDASDIVLLSDAAEALAEQPAQVDPCPGCLKGCVCRTPKCGRLKLPADHPLRSEQPAQQEPVVWMYVNKSTHETKFQKHMRDFIDHSLWSEVPLYGEPLANHELQCVCGAVWLGDELVHLPDKRPPAQRTWAGLTRAERFEIEKAMSKYYDYQHECKTVCLPEFARAIEAKLKEKNA